MGRPFSGRKIPGDAWPQNTSSPLSFENELAVVRVRRKPSSVPPAGYPTTGDDHSSSPTVTGRIEQPTRGLGRVALRAIPTRERRNRLRPPTRPCSRWGLPCRGRYRPRGGLLPHRFTLTAECSRTDGGLFSVALSLAFPPPGVTRHRTRWSSDFPPVRPRFRRCTGDRLSSPDGRTDTFVGRVSQHFPEGLPRRSFPKGRPWYSRGVRSA